MIQKVMLFRAITLTILIGALTSRTVSFTLSFQSYYDVYIDYDNSFHCEPMFPTSFQFHVSQIFKLIARYIMTVSLPIELMLDINFNLIVNLCTT